MKKGLKHKKSRELTTKCFKRLGLKRKCKSCNKINKLDIHHERYPTTISSVLMAIYNKQIYYLCIKHHNNLHSEIATVKNRKKILRFLSKEGRSSSAKISILTGIEQSRAEELLKKLRRDKLVLSEKKGNGTFWIAK